MRGRGSNADDEENVKKYWCGKCETEHPIGKHVESKQPAECGSYEDHPPHGYVTPFLFRGKHCPGKGN